MSRKQFPLRLKLETPVNRPSEQVLAERTILCSGIDGFNSEIVTAIFKLFVSMDETVTGEKK